MNVNILVLLVLVLSKTYLVLGTRICWKNLNLGHFDIKGGKNINIELPLITFSQPSLCKTLCRQSSYSQIYKRYRKCFNCQLLGNDSWYSVHARQQNLKKASITIKCIIVRYFGLSLMPYHCVKLISFIYYCRLFLPLILFTSECNFYSLLTAA